MRVLIEQRYGIGCTMIKSSAIPIIEPISLKILSVRICCREMYSSVIIPSQLRQLHVKNTNYRTSGSLNVEEEKQCSH